MTGGSNGPGSPKCPGSPNGPGSPGCRACGALLRAEAMFCGECGTAARRPGWMDAALDRSLPRAPRSAAERASVREGAGAQERDGMPERPGVPELCAVSERAAAPERTAAPEDRRQASVVGPAVPVSASGVERPRPASGPEYETTVRTGGDRPPDPEPGPAARPELELRPAAGPEPEPGLGAELWHPAEQDAEQEPAWLSEPDPERPRPAEPPVAQEDRSAAVPPTMPMPTPEPRTSPPVGPGRESGGSTVAAPFDRGPREKVCGSVVARFSTGEVVTLHGTGLIGRNPTPQEGERFDALVRILDPARSVSKTHLEFVVDAGRLWIRDRFSGNGTILRHPNGTGSRCEGGRRYRVGEGDRVEIGEQYFDVR